MATESPYVLSVVIGTRNRLERLRECIESIGRETSVPTKIYVTDAGSTDGSVEYLNSIRSESMQVTLHSQRLGQARAYNEIFAQVDTPYVCWLSDDNVVVNRGLDRAVRVLGSVPRVGMVGLKVRDVQGPFISEPYIGGVSEAGILNVNQGVLRTGILQGLGGFSEEFMDYGIDPDLTARVLYAGHDIVYTKDVAILHWREWGESEILAAQMAKQTKYKALYREKYCDKRNAKSAAQRRVRAVTGVKRVLKKVSSLIGSNRAEHWARDWYNIVMGRYISLFDPIKTMGKDYHLVQRCDPNTVRPYIGGPQLGDR